MSTLSLLRTKEELILPIGASIVGTIITENGIG